MPSRGRDDQTVVRLRRSGLGSMVVGAAALAGLCALIAPRLDDGTAFVLQAFGLFALAALAIDAALPRLHPHARFGAANGATLGRVVIACVLAGLIGGADLPSGLAWLPAIAVLLALLGDGLDGWLARRQGTSSAFGARFDLETDALTVLILAVLVFQQGGAGPWVLAIGGLRYGFVVAGLFWPLLAKPLPPSKRRQGICVVQYLVLGVALVPGVSPAAATALAAGGLFLLLVSFLTDIGWLVCHAKPPHLQQRESPS